MTEAASAPQIPFRDVSVTAQIDQDARPRACPVCGTRPESSRAKFCSHRCQMIAFRRRQGHQRIASELTAHTVTKPARDHVVYECPACDARYLGDQRCPECNRFARRLGPGGQCPGCNDILTVDELLGR
jgi:endogenous inhibitor of DNA gyrase (YacG/DUF329 family)